MALEVVPYLVALVSSLASALLLSRANRRHRMSFRRLPPESTRAAEVAYLLAFAAAASAALWPDRRLGDAPSFGLMVAAIAAPALVVNALHNRRLAGAGLSPRAAPGRRDGWDV